MIIFLTIAVVLLIVVVGLSFKLINKNYREFDYQIDNLRKSVEDKASNFLVHNVQSNIDTLKKFVDELQDEQIWDDVDFYNDNTYNYKVTHVGLDTFKVEYVSSSSFSIFYYSDSSEPKITYITRKELQKRNLNLKLEIAERNACPKPEDHGAKSKGKRK